MRPITDQDKPAIYILDGEIRINLDQAVRLLKKAEVEIYDRGGVLCRPMRLPAWNVDHHSVKRPAGAITLVPVSQEWLALQLSDVAQWLVFDKRSNNWVRKDPPWIAKADACSNRVDYRKQVSRPRAGGPCRPGAEKADTGSAP